MKAWSAAILCGAMLFAASGRLAHAQTPATAPAVATVEFVQLPATITAADGRSREVRVGDRILQGETIVTGAGGELHALTEDHGYIAVRPDTRVAIRELHAAGDEHDSMTVELLRGTLRLISGWIGKHNPRNYRVAMPTATIGIRGTDHEPTYVPPEDRREGIEPGAYEKVHSGSTVLRNAAGEIGVEAGENAFAPHDASARPVKLAKAPEFHKPGANEARIEERKVAVEAAQESQRVRRAAETKEHEHRTERQKRERRGAR